ncbi:MAG: hypothetical protein E7598_00335 [Ruminococcaceae bacterium]|nr:hypothetical protein [Oscillospiraceae bacterium]
MSWKNVKNFLIVLLVAVNIVLSIYAYRYYFASTFTDADTAQIASEVLKSSGINIGADTLAVKKDSAETLYCSYDREHYLALVCSLFFGKEADGIYLVPSGIKAETLEGDSITLGYDMQINYTNAALKDEITAALSKADPIEAEESKAVRQTLETLIALPENSLSDAECTAYGDYVFITANQFENSLPLYGMTCIFGIRNGKLVHADGKHFFGVPEGKESSQILDKVNIMFSEKLRGETGTVKDIRLCYTLYEDSLSDRMLFIPSYEILYEDGRTNAINALTKEKY